MVALLAPVTGVWVDAPWRRRRALAVLSALAVVLTLGDEPDPRRLPLPRWPGLVLLAVRRRRAAIWPRVPYNAMLRQLSTPQTSGQISGLGLGLGYFGSVVLLLVVYFGFIAGDGGPRGLFDLPVADGQNVRAAMLFTAIWFALFALPLLIAVPSPHPDPLERTCGRSASSADIASCGPRSAANGDATTTSSIT